MKFRTEIPFIMPRYQKSFPVFLVLVLIVFSGCGPKQPVSTEELAHYLQVYGMPPEDYVVSKFQDHDYVFLGEYHRIRQNVELVLALIPRLYHNGINTLAIEFGDARDQHLVDSLLALPHFDRQLAREIMFRSDPLWGYKEYIDIYRVAWEVNHSDTMDHTKPFRVVNLGAHYDPCKKGGAWKDLDPDVFMARILFKEVIDKHEKALVYSGNHHAFTHYHQPLYNFKKDSCYGYTTTRMGNVVYDSLGERTFNIYLHAGWTSGKGWDKPCVRPVNGAMRPVMKALGNKPVGFDVAGTPFGKLTSTNSYYALCHPGFLLEQYCDGYIWQVSFKDMQPITMEKDFITPGNIVLVKKHLQCLGVDEKFIRSLTVENANEKLFEDIRMHFRHLRL